VGVEGEAEVTRALQYLKDIKHIEPEIIVHDFFAADCKGTANVYGEEKSAIDPFHVMQEVNRAIVKDLVHFRKRLFSTELHELQTLTTIINKLQKQFKKLNSFSQPLLQLLPIIDPTHNIGQFCLKITKTIFALIESADPTIFFDRLNQILTDFHQDSHLALKAFAMAVEDHLPKHSITEKNYSRTIMDLLKKLKTLYNESRKPIKAQQSKFSKRKWALFYQPNKLTVDRAKMLTKFLTQYPTLQQYRDLTLTIGSIYRLPLPLLKDQIIDDLQIQENWGEELKTAIMTLKKNRDSILRFRAFFEKYPKLPKKCRANTEYLNLKLKKVFQSGLYLKGWDRLENELELQMGGEIRNFLTAL